MEYFVLGLFNRSQLAGKKCKLSPKLSIMQNRWKLFMGNFVYIMYYISQRFALSLGLVFVVNLFLVI